MAAAAAKRAAASELAALGEREHVLAKIRGTIRNASGQTAQTAEMVLQKGTAGAGARADAAVAKFSRKMDEVLVEASKDARDHVNKIRDEAAVDLELAAEQAHEVVSGTQSRLDRLLNHTAAATQRGIETSRAAAQRGLDLAARHANSMFEAAPAEIHEVQNATLHLAAQAAVNGQRSVKNLVSAWLALRMPKSWQRPPAMQPQLLSRRHG
jgi:hypothetical protein